LINFITVRGVDQSDNDNSFLYCIGGKRYYEGFPALGLAHTETSFELILLVSIALIAAVAEILVIERP
jgi:hypothetical protein